MLDILLFIYVVGFLLIFFFCIFTEQVAPTPTEEIAYAFAVSALWFIFVPWVLYYRGKELEEKDRAE